MSHFDRAFLQLLQNEGGYSNVAGDKGGKTRFGVTEAVARADGYLGDMKDFSEQRAKAIYLKRYWLPAFDSFTYDAAFQVFDGAVNSGLSQSVRWLQRTVGVADDGVLGPVTERAVTSIDPMRVLVGYNVERLLFLTKLNDFKQFGAGWVNRCAHNLQAGIQ